MVQSYRKSLRTDAPLQENHQENSDKNDEATMPPVLVTTTVTTIAVATTTTARPLLATHANTTLRPWRGAETTIARKNVNIPTGHVTSPSTVAPGVTTTNQMLRSSGVLGVPSLGSARPSYLCTQEVKDILFLFFSYLFDFCEVGKKMLSKNG